MQTDVRFLRPLIENILRDRPEYREWSVQGFGMLRTYLGPPSNRKQIRLNIWDSRLAVPNVSTIHDHPWSFTSVIVAGCFVNLRYHQHAAITDPTHHFTLIKTGEGGGPKNERIASCILRPDRPEVYGPGDLYAQSNNEIHESLPVDGCVTINERVGDTEVARVFWPHGTNWVDAIPRPATVAEVVMVCDDALKRWF